VQNQPNKNKDLISHRGHREHRERQEARSQKTEVRRQKSEESKQKKNKLPTVYCLLLTYCSLLFLIACSSPPPENMVYIPPGKFIMGSAENIDNEKSFEYGFAKPWIADASPHREIYLEGYYIDKYEVSNADYGKFVKATGHRPPDHWGKDSPPDKIANHPVTNVSWHDALEYCKWRGKRLPTEEEWEKAARGTNGRLYPWGNEFDFSKANVSQNQSEETDTKDVKSYENGKSHYGVHNMVGNIWEWTLDWYKPYPGNTYKSEFFGERFKVFRGNSYSRMGHFPKDKYERMIKEFSKVTFRFYSDPSGRFHDVGCRCVKQSDE